MNDGMTDTTVNPVDAPVIDGGAEAPAVNEDGDEVAETQEVKEDDDEEAEKPVAEEGETPEAPAL